MLEKIVEEDISFESLMDTSGQLLILSPDKKTSKYFYLMFFNALDLIGIIDYFIGASDVQWNTEDPVVYSLSLSPARQTNIHEIKVYENDKIGDYQIHNIYGDFCIRFVDENEMTKTQVGVNSIIHFQGQIIYDGDNPYKYLKQRYMSLEDLECILQEIYDDPEMITLRRKVSRLFPYDGNE